MRLYCVMIKDKDDKIIDVIHITSDCDKNVHIRMDKFLNGCKKYDLEGYDSYSFFNVWQVDDYYVKMNYFDID